MRCDRDRTRMSEKIQWKVSSQRCVAARSTRLWRENREFKSDLEEFHVPRKQSITAVPEVVL